MTSKPVFVKIAEPEILNRLIEQLKTEIDRAKVSLEDINTLSDEETKRFGGWKTKFGEMNGKLDSVKDSMLEPEDV